MTNKIEKYGYFYILSSCESNDPSYKALDGTEFRYLSHAIDFLKNHKEDILKEPDKIYIMVWQEQFNDDCVHYDNDCVDQIYITDLFYDHAEEKTIYSVLATGNTSEAKIISFTSKEAALRYIASDIIDVIKLLNNDGYTNITIENNGVGKASVIAAENIVYDWEMYYSELKGGE